MSTYGVKINKCFEPGMQGVSSQLEYTAAQGTEIFSYNAAPKTNSRFVLKEYLSLIIGHIPTEPEPSYNFNITLQNSTGFYGTVDATFTLKDGDLNETSNTIKVYWDNPNFDVSDNYTIIHAHIWHDGIHYCGHIDGYVEATT